MNAFLYGTMLQFKIDIRSRTMLVTCYLVPLLFFAVMGGIFTSLMPEAKDTLIQSMTVMVDIPVIVVHLTCREAG